MIQRVQSLYLLAVLILCIVCMCVSVGRFVGDNGDVVAVMNNLTLEQGEAVSYRPWALFAELLLVCILTFFTIFTYKKRMRQIRMTIFSCIVLIGYFITYGVFAYLFGAELGASFRPSLCASFPLIALILNWLAIRAIGADEMLVRSLDRIR